MGWNTTGKDREGQASLVALDLQMKAFSYTRTHKHAWLLPLNKPQRWRETPVTKTQLKQLICTDISSGASREAHRRARLLLYYPQWPNHRGDTRACMLIYHGSRSIKLHSLRLEERSLRTGAAGIFFIFQKQEFASCNTGASRRRRQLVPAVSPDFTYIFNKLAMCPTNYPEQQT